MSEPTLARAGTWEPDALVGREVWRAVRAALRGDRLLLTTGLALVVVSGAAVAAGPPIVRFAIDGVEGGDIDAVRVGAIAYLAIVVLGGLATGFRTWVMGIVGQRFLHQLRRDSVAGALRLDLGTFERARQGDLQARVTQDVAALSEAAIELLPTTTTLVIAVAGGFAAIVILSPTCALLALLVLPPVVLAGAWLRRRSNQVYPEYRRRVATMTGDATETVVEAAGIQAYNAEQRQLERFRASNWSVVDGFMAGTYMRNRFFPVLTVAQAVVAAAVVVFAATQCLDGEMTVGTAVAVVLALGGMLGPLVMLFGQLDAVFAARAALVRVIELSAVESPTEDGTEELPERGPLVFDDVSFAYLSGRAVIEEVNLEIRTGEQLALVGVSGSGKSTLMRLATGLAHPSGGRVLLGDVDLRDATEEGRRLRLVLLPQETFLLDGTIAENALLADPGLKAADVDAAVTALGIGPWVESLADGIHTSVGADGVQLSAGGRQLVSLLRVMLVDPAVVALDEPTSLLDPATEALVAAALSRALRGRTVLIVAHRLATARRCDRIAVVEGGRIVATGSYEELVATSHAFAALWENEAMS